MITTPTLEAAQQYVKHGWSIIPLEQGTKRAHVKWKKYQTEAATVEEVERWWSKWPDANIGIITGAVSGVIVLDVDSEEGFREIEERGGFPVTATVVTSKGRHFYFRHPGTGTIGNFARKIPGCDLRGDGGLVAAPPSVHSSGVIYEWESPDVEIADPPEWLLEVITPAPIVVDASALPAANREHLNGAANDPDKTRRFVLGCIRNEVAKVQSAADGEKHQQLLKSSVYLAGYLHTGAITQEEIESALFDAIALRANDKRNAAETIRDGIGYGTKKPLDIPPPNIAPKVLLRGRDARRFIVGDTSSSPDDSDTESDSGDDIHEKAVNNGLYAVQNGRTVLSVSKEKTDATGGTEASMRSFVWDGAACITGEIVDEDGAAIFEIEGRTIKGRKFKFESEASKFTDAKAVAGAISNGAGAGTVIYAGMEKHLAPSINSFTDFNNLRHGRRFKRVGWTRDGREFIIPGLEPSDVIMALDRDLPYRVVAPVDGVLAPEAIEALEMLIQSHRHQLTTVGICHALLAPLAQLGDWRDDKFGLFVAGRTGSFKTSVMSHVMCLYGDFSNEDKLLKFGLGGSSKAMMSYTADAADVPLMIDNFKPGTGRGQNDAQTLIHGVIEGSEMKRLNRDGKSRQTSKEIHCWPIFTGEDVIDDAASVARTLIVSAAWDGGETNDALTAVQRLAHWLPHVGGAWLSWLMTEEARVVTAEVKGKFFERRSHWSTQLHKSHPGMINRSRVASSLALCQCAWEIALCCPYLASTLNRYSHAFDKSLQEISDSMGSYAAQTHEANRYISAVRAMLLSNRAYLVNKARDPDTDDKRVFLGWKDDEYVYLQPDNTYREVLEFLRNSNGLNGLGMNTMHRQLDQLKFLARKNPPHLTALKRVGTESKAQRLLWFKASDIVGDENDEESA